MIRISSIALIIVLMAALFLSGCALFEASPKTFTKAGMSITLTDRFTERDYVSFTAVYDSQYVAVFVLKEEFTLFEGSALGKNSSLNDYANAVILANGLDVSPVTEDGLTFFTYQKENNGTDCTYFATVHKSDDAFWLIQFSAKTEQYESQKDNILTYAKSVSFSS